MNMELHSTGASFVAGKEEHNPRDLVADLIKANPGATRQELFSAFRALLDTHSDEYQRSVDYYFFINMHDYMVTNRNRHNRHTSPATRAQRKEQSDQMIESFKQQIMMLDLTMPNGKPMRDCTGAEMATMGNRFQKIAERVGKAKTVGEVLNEDQVRAIMK